MKKLLLACLSVTLIAAMCDEVDYQLSGVDGGDADSDGDGDGGADGDTDGDADSDGDADTGWQPGDEKYSGVDILVVIDNSGSMEQEQQILATSLYELLSVLVTPTAGWPLPAVEDLRVAVVSSDMGLQYGAGRSVEGFPYESEVPTCTDQDSRGDDGRFRTSMPGQVELLTGEIQCDAGGEQCPLGWSCVSGVCASPSGDDEMVNCLDLGSVAWAESSPGAENAEVTKQVACMARLGTSGCGIEQQLEASVRGLERPDQDGFLVGDHLLAVVIVTDEEDCSIEKPGLFETDEWLSKTLVKESDPNSGMLNTACNLPGSNEQNYLFSTSRYREELVALKGDPKAVLFGAIVGVPAGNSPCQGRGDQLDECLSHPDMQHEVQVFAQNGTPYKHFKPACTRTEDDVQVTAARPGRRYVKVAQDFGASGYVFSICNASWAAAARQIATMAAERVDAEL